MQVKTNRYIHSFVSVYRVFQYPFSGKINIMCIIERQYSTNAVRLSGCFYE